MRLLTGVADEVGLSELHTRADSPPIAALAAARRRARIALLGIWTAFAVSAYTLPCQALLAYAVLTIGVSMVLETVHGALAFDRMLDRIRRWRS
jgi:hypothetical protein